jgi:hypothetical protein
MVTSPLAKNRTLYSFEMQLLDNASSGNFRSVWIASTPNGDVKLSYNTAFVQGDDMAFTVGAALSSFEADLVTLGYVLV